MLDRQVLATELSRTVLGAKWCIESLDKPGGLVCAVKPLHTANVSVLSNSAINIAATPLTTASYFHVTLITQLELPMAI